MIRFAIVLLVAVALCGCGPGKPRAKRDTSPVGDFRSKTYVISEHEHAVILEYPNWPTPTRCIVFVNDKTNTSNMRCDDDNTAPNLPEQGPELER